MSSHVADFIITIIVMACVLYIYTQIFNNGSNNPPSNMNTT